MSPPAPGVSTSQGMSVGTGPSDAEDSTTHPRTPLSREFVCVRHVFGLWQRKVATTSLIGIFSAVCWAKHRGRRPAAAGFGLPRSYGGRHVILPRRKVGIGNSGNCFL